MTKECTSDGETACWSEKLSTELNNVKQRFMGLEKELDNSNQLLELSRERYDKLESEYQILRGERDSLLQTVSESNRTLSLISDEKENIVKDLNAEVQKRKNIEEEIKHIGVAFASRQKSFASFHNEFKSKVEILISKNPAQHPNLLGNEK